MFDEVFRTKWRLFASHMDVESGFEQFITHARLPRVVEKIIKCTYPKIRLYTDFNSRTG